MTPIQLETIDSAGRRETLALTPAPHRPYTLSVQHPDGSTKLYTEWFLWHNLLALRQDLELQNRLLLCNGSRPNAVVSGMSLDMTGGRIAYLARLGQPVTRDSTADIFLPAPPAAVGSIAEQIAFKEQWLKAPREQIGTACSTPS